MGVLQRLVDAAFCCGKSSALFENCGCGCLFVDGAAMRAVVCKSKSLLLSALPGFFESLKYSDARRFVEAVEEVMFASVWADCRCERRPEQSCGVAFCLLSTCASYIIH